MSETGDTGSESAGELEPTPAGDTTPTTRGSTSDPGTFAAVGGTGSGLPPAGGSSGVATTRRVVALLVVLVMAGGFFYAGDTGSLRHCETKVTRSDDKPPKVSTEESCRPLPVESLIPGLLLVLALMWPDLASVELFGLGRVARRLTAQEERQNELQAAQHRLENQIEANLTVQQNPTINFAMNPYMALLTEAKVNAHGQQVPGTGAPAEGQDRDALLVSFLSAAAPLKPWLNLARRLNDPTFAAVVREGATSGSPADDPRLLPPDKRLLQEVQRPGHPLDVEEVVAWATENSLQLTAVRDTLNAGSHANPESLRVAVKFAGQLFSDLQRRGLVATT